MNRMLDLVFMVDLQVAHEVLASSTTEEQRTAAFERTHAVLDEIVSLTGYGRRDAVIRLLKRLMDRRVDEIDMIVHKAACYAYLNDVRAGAI